MKGKQYGVTKPKALDFMLSIVIVLMSLCSIWVSVWITVAKKQAITVDILAGFLDALKVNIYGGWLVAVQSVVMYAGFAFALVACLVVLFRKKFTALAGVFAICFAAATFSLGLGFVVTFAMNEILPIVVVGLIILLMALVYTTYKVAKLMIVYMFAGSRLYDSYKEEIGKEILKIKVEQPAPAGKHQEVPTYETYETPVDEKEEVDFYFKNSNGYGGFNYNEEFENYNAQIDELMNGGNIQEELEEPVEQEEKQEEVFEVAAVIEEDDRIHKGDIDKLKQKQNNDFTFEQKLERAFDVARDFFAELKEYAEGLGFKSALTKQAETFSYKNTKYAMIDLAGQKGLKVYYKLDLNDYVDTPIPLRDMSKVKKYQHTPVLLVVKSELALKRAKKLFDDLKEKFGVEVEQEEQNIDIVQELMAEDNQEADDETLEIKSNHHTFEQKLKMAKPEVRKRFVELKAYFESLGFKSTLTKKGEIFTYKNTKYAMICAAGKNGLKIYYKLDAHDYDESPIPVKNMIDVKKYEKTPTLFVAKSDLAIKRAKKLMDDVKEQLDQTEKE